MLQFLVLLLFYTVFIEDLQFIGNIKMKMMKINKIIYLIIILFSFVFTSCNESNSEAIDTPTQGNITVITDNSFQNVIKAEVETFTSLYKNAR
jgi:hypothetical protein